MRLTRIGCVCRFDYFKNSTPFRILASCTFFGSRERQRDRKLCKVLFRNFVNIIIRPYIKYDIAGHKLKNVNNYVHFTVYTRPGIIINDESIFAKRKIRVISIVLLKKTLNNVQ